MNRQRVFANGSTIGSILSYGTVHLKINIIKCKHGTKLKYSRLTFRLKFRRKQLQVPYRAAYLGCKPGIGD